MCEAAEADNDRLGEEMSALQARIDEVCKTPACPECSPRENGGRNEDVDVSWGGRLVAVMR